VIYNRVSVMSVWDYFYSVAKHQTQISASLSAKPDQDSFNESFQSAIILTSTFYINTKVFQHLAGAMSIHSGRPLVASTFGLASVITSALMSFEINEALSKIKSKNSSSFSFVEYSKEEFVLDDRISSTLIAYSILERKSLRTAVPSSVISIGVHAKHGNFLGMFRGSVPSSDITATSKERYKIQQLGKRLVIYLILLD
jgi:hypothetical protein